MTAVRLDGTPMIIQLKGNALIVTGRNLAKLPMRTTVKAQRVSLGVLIACPITIDRVVTGQKCGPGAIAILKFVMISGPLQLRAIHRVTLAFIHNRRIESAAGIYTMYGAQLK